MSLHGNIPAVASGYHAMPSPVTHPPTLPPDPTHTGTGTGTGTDAQPTLKRERPMLNGTDEDTGTGHEQIKRQKLNDSGLRVHIPAPSPTAASIPFGSPASTGSTLLPGSGSGSGSAAPSAPDSILPAERTRVCQS